MTCAPVIDRRLASVERVEPLRDPDMSGDVALEMAVDDIDYEDFFCEHWLDAEFAAAYRGLQDLLKQPIRGELLTSKVMC